MIRDFGRVVNTHIVFGGDESRRFISAVAYSTMTIPGNFKHRNYSWGGLADLLGWSSSAGSEAVRSYPKAHTSTAKVVDFADALDTSVGSGMSVSPPDYPSPVALDIPVGNVHVNASSGQNDELDEATRLWVAVLLLVIMTMMVKAHFDFLSLNFETLQAATKDNADSCFYCRGNRLFNNLLADILTKYVSQNAWLHSFSAINTYCALGFWVLRVLWLVVHSLTLVTVCWNTGNSSTVVVSSRVADQALDTELRLPRIMSSSLYLFKCSSHFSSTPTNVATVPDFTQWEHTISPTLPGRNLTCS